MTWNGQFYPIMQLFQSIPTESGSEWPISPNSQFFQSFPTEVAQNDLKWSISPDLLFPLK